MMFLTITAFIGGRGLPATLTVTDSCGRVVVRRKVTSAVTCVNVRAFCGGLVVRLTPFGDDYYPVVRYIRFEDLFSCRRLSLDLSFKKVATLNQTFYLYDENYSLPVKNATLFFTEA